MKILCLAIFVLLIQGCALNGDPLKQPGVFIFSKWDGDLDGEYNPKGFTTAEVQKQISRACNDKAVGDYTEEKKPNGLVVFSAVCRSSSIGESAEYKVERTPYGMAVTEIPSLTFP